MLKNMENETHIIGFKRVISEAAVDTDKFFGWFDNKSTFEETYTQAAWDFSWHIAVPLAPYISKPVHTMCALEIGGGGGRLSAQAARHFGRVVSVDIHDQLSKVSDKCKQLGITNIEFKQGNGYLLPCDDQSVDVVYSFIVFQHLEKISILESYLRETFRVLCPGGLALIYAGRHGPNSLRKASKLLYRWDVLMEKFRLPNGYKEEDAPINSTNLRVSRQFMKNLGAKIGFKYLTCYPSRKNIPMGTKFFGGQHGFLWRRP
jgi:ubiquinone/menaquinone biosynthesis C-methylase UbiE